MSTETYQEKFARVELMARGDATWDLSDNDISAIDAVLREAKRACNLDKQIQNECTKIFEANGLIVELQARVEKLQAAHARAVALSDYKTAIVQKLLTQWREGESPTHMAKRLAAVEILEQFTARELIEQGKK